jgi:UDP-N-acetylenolpyruvoylglucosamine reductase
VDGIASTLMAVRDGVEHAFGIRLEAEPLLINCSL